MRVFCYQFQQARVQEPMLNRETLQSHSTCVFKVKPGKLYIQRPKVIKLFSSSTKLSTKFILLINVKMLTNVGILTFISMIHTTSGSLKATSLFVCILVFVSSWNFLLSRAEHEKSFITSGPGLLFIGLSIGWLFKLAIGTITICMGESSKFPKSLTSEILILKLAGCLQKWIISSLNDCV